MSRVAYCWFDSNTVPGIKTNVKVMTPQKCVKLGKQKGNHRIFNVILQISSFVHGVGEVAISEELDWREELFEVWWEYGVGR